MTDADPGGRELIAIVGIGCRLPGGANDPDSLWRLLGEEFDAIGPLPADRFADEDLTTDRASRSGGFLSGIDGFDAQFFEMAPREAERLDPQQRLLLETSWEALEDAGITRDRLAGTNAGVFVGMWLNDFESHLFADPTGVDLHMTTGTGRYSASGRLSFFLDLRGPSISIDTACSSSLVAVHLACRSLRTGECDLALAGGANVILQPHITNAYSQSGMMAPDGRCKFGDASADGYVRSDGAAMVALKRLSSALADGDPIYAVIRGSAVTNDGRSSGFLTTPGQAGQELMLRRAYEDAGVDPRTVQYVEAHGTGTAAGDPVELGALAAVVGAGRDADERCLVGSLKTNVGHTEGAAGVAGLIKVALGLAHGEIPASLHLRTPNPNVAWAESGLEVCAARRPWPAGDEPARGGVSSFGIAGTNAHIVLEAPPAPAEPSAVEERRTHVLPLSARSSGALQELAGAYRELLRDADPVAVADICGNAARRRTHHEVRLAVVAEHGDELANGLEAAARGESPAGAASVETAPRVVFVFPGQGSQWHGMARELLATEPAFRAAMIRCDAAIRQEAGWSLLDELARDETCSRLTEIDVIQPVLFAVQVALAAEWQAWGVAPSAVVGHSMGEVAAAHVAGALSLPDAVAVICRRSRLMRRVAGQGAMALVELSFDEAVEAIAGREDKISIAVSNGPRSTVISGDGEALDAVLAHLKSREIFSRHVKVDVASHSPQMDPLLDELRAGLAHLAPRPASVPVYSTVDVAAVDGPALGPGYWAHNLRQPVRFGATTELLAADGYTVFIEISPHPVLTSAVSEVLRQGGHQVLAVASLRRGESERAAMLTGLASLYVAGAPVDWRQVFPVEGRHVRLPTYPWQHEHFWYEARRSVAGGGHPLLGHAVRPASVPGATYWETTLDGPIVDAVRDHVVRGTAVMPATAFIAVALAAAGAGEPGPHALADLTIAEVLPVSAGLAMQVALEPHAAGHRRVRVFADDQQGGMRLHAESGVETDAVPAAVASESLSEIRSRCDGHRSSEAHDGAMRARGLDYGPAFRTVAECFMGDGEVLGRLRLPPEVGRGHAASISLLDGALQLVVAALPPATGTRTFMPVRAERVEIRAPLEGADLWAHATATAGPGGEYHGTVTVLDGAGHVLAEVRGLHLRPLGRGAADLADLLYELQWQDAERQPGDAAAVAAPWLVFASDTVGDDLARRLRAAGRRCVVVAAGASYHQESGDEVAIRPGVDADYARLVRDVFPSGPAACAGIVYAWPTAVPDDGAALVESAEELGCAGPIALVQALDATAGAEPPRLWLVTRGAQSGGGQPVASAQAVTWGLGRVLATERPEHQCTLIDVDPDADDDGELFAEIDAGTVDQQIVLRAGSRRVARLVRRSRPADATPTGETAVYRLAATTPGALDSIRPCVVARRSPGPGEVELAVQASALNFLDVLKAMGICPGFDPDPAVALGAECAATVVAAGPGVDGVAVGDEVIAITSSYRQTSTLSAYVTLPAAFVVPRPPCVSAEQAGALPVAYLTAYYALHELGRIRRGDRVLIHAATGGVGLAAIALCRRVGAEVFATAGSADKRAYLSALGIEHVFDSRRLAFADDVRAATAGRGVDIVLNSLTGAALAAGLATLAPRGRFVEIGKRDIYADTHIGLQPFAANLSFFAVDLARMTEEDPAYVSGLFRDVMGLVAAGELPPLPTTAVPVAEAAEAFRTMARAAHIGKLVVTGWDQPARAEVPLVRPDGTYLVTGGLGALGLAVATHLVDHGAGHVALLGRSAPSADAQLAIAQLEGRGARVSIVRADVADPAELAGALERLATTAAPLRGVVHAAGVLADATIATMDRATLRAALRPKLAGGWNLHVLTQDQPLDFFVLFSSVASVLGLAGQANYAAGNAFLDALAHQRRAAGRPALAVNWGPWAAIGLAAAAANRGGRLADRGLGSVAADDALAALDALLTDGDVQAAVMPLDAERWVAANPTAVSLLGALADAQPSPAGHGSLRGTLAAIASADRRQRVLEDAVCAQLGPVLRLAPERIDRQRPLKALGLDSLMALELRNRLEAEVGSALPATVAWTYPTVATLARHLAERMDLSLPTAAVEAASAAEPDADDLEWAELSQQDLEAMLDDELAAVDELLQSE